MTTYLLILGILIIHTVAAIPQENRCRKSSTCNLGEKQLCTLMEGTLTFQKCLEHRAKCEVKAQSYCPHSQVPICKDDQTSCTCSCGEKKGPFGNKRTSG